MKTQRQSSTADLMQKALDHHQTGAWRQAECLYKQILNRQPRHATALHFRGLIAHQQGNYAVALQQMARAIEIEPRNATFRFNLAQVLEASGRLALAAQEYRAALAADPSMSAAHHRLGHLLLQEGKLPEATASYSRALVLKPDCAEAINSLGTLLHRMGRLEQAVVLFRKALALEPAYPEAHNNLALVLHELGHTEEAIASCREAVALKPALAAAHCNLGNLLKTSGDHAGAAESCRQAIALDPQFAEAHLNLGNALRSQGLLAEAASCYRDALRLQPTYAAAWNNLAETLKDQARIPEAVHAFEQALALEPRFAAAYSNSLYLHAFTRDIEPVAERALAQGWERAVLTDEERAAARHRADRSSGVFSTAPRSGRRLRLGIVSAELGTHAVAEFLQPVVECLDRSRFHLTLFPTAGRTCERSEKFRSLADSFVALTGVPDTQAAEVIRREQIDILIDTTGHTYGGRLGIFAHRAAPVQCTYIGYWSTTGLSEMDWFFGDPYCTPALDAHFSERIWRLPRIAVAYRGDSTLPESSWEPDRDGTLWLGSFNKLGKIREQTLHLWANAMHALPEARLLLEDGAQHEDQTHARIVTALAAAGIAASRIEFIPYVPGHERHMLLYNRLDIALDTVPFNSGTTAFDALWMGVPLVALEGDWLGGRMGSSILKAFGKPEWAARSEDEFVAIVKRLAHNPEERKHLRKLQRSEMKASPLCDAAAMARALEDAFEGMHDHWLSQ